MEIKRLAKQVRWFAINVLVVAGVWYGGFQGVEWAANLTLFYAWTMVVLSFAFGPVMLVGAVAELDEDINPHERQTVPSPVDITVDVVVSLGMAATGWMVTAVAFLLHSLIVHLCLAVWKRGYDKRQESRAEKQVA